MAAHRPLVITDGQVQRLPVGDYVLSPFPVLEQTLELNEDYTIPSDIVGRSVSFDGSGFTVNSEITVNGYWVIEEF